jgi:GNAT superfamily N-acetyltransferase
MNDQIRQARPDDAEALTRSCFPRSTIEQTRLNLKEALRLAEQGEGVSLLAVRDGEVVGNVTLARGQHRMCRHRVDLGGFVINPVAQGSGLARLMVEAAAEWARARGCDILEIGCRGGTHAEGAYKGLGFVEWGRLKNGYHDHDRNYDEVRLYRPV